MLDTTDRLAFIVRWLFLGGAVGYWLVMALGLVAPHWLIPAGDPIFSIF
jgi:hypothetical protein